MGCLHYLSHHNSHNCALQLLQYRYQTRQFVNNKLIYLHVLSHESSHDYSNCYNVIMEDGTLHTHTAVVANMPTIHKLACLTY